MRGVWSISDIPVHSCLLLSSAAEAISFPRGEMQLSFCATCGFVGNVAFDVAMNRYSSTYEETQGFSQTFGRFAKQLANDLVHKHNLEGRTILEIGCGKGEFLAEMCAAGTCNGIGIDPAYRPDRRPAAATERIQYIQDFYDRRYAHLEVDCIVCRHTLEHIAPTFAFVSELRATIGDRLDTVVFFELPDMLRILREGAFWDLYYEHCSYFSAGSLARLFRRCGFDIVELERAYDDQYLLLTAVPADRATEAALPIEDDLDELVRLVDAFPGTVEVVKGTWRQFLNSGVNDRKRTVIWGSGSKGVAFLTTLGVTDEIDCVVDINPHRQGTFMAGTGHEIVSPESLADHGVDNVIVMNPIYVDEIRGTLSEMGLHPNVVAV